MIDAEKEMMEIRDMLFEMIDILNVQLEKEGQEKWTMGPSVEVNVPSFRDDHAIWTGETFPSFINLFKDGTSVVNRGHHGKTLEELLTSMKETTKEELELFRTGMVWGLKHD